MQLPAIATGMLVQMSAEQEAGEQELAGILEEILLLISLWEDVCFLLILRQNQMKKDVLF